MIVFVIAEHARRRLRLVVVHVIRWERCKPVVLRSYAGFPLERSDVAVEVRVGQLHLVMRVPGQSANLRVGFVTYAAEKIILIGCSVTPKNVSRDSPM